MVRAAGHVGQELQHVRAHRVVGEVVLDAPDRVEAERLGEVGEAELVPVDLGVGPRRPTPGRSTHIRRAWPNATPRPMDASDRTVGSAAVRYEPVFHRSRRYRMNLEGDGHPARGLGIRPEHMTDTVHDPATDSGIGSSSAGETVILDRVVVRFAGDSGDGMQLTGDRFTSVSAAVRQRPVDAAGVSRPRSAPPPARCTASPASRCTSRTTRSRRRATSPTCSWR